MAELEATMTETGELLWEPPVDARATTRMGHFEPGAGAHLDAAATERAGQRP